MLGTQLSVIFRRVTYDSANINGSGLLSENVGRPWPEERIPVAAPSHQFVASLNIRHWDVPQWYHVHAKFRDDRPHGLKAELRDRGTAW